MLNAAPPDRLVELPDPALLAVVLATGEGLLADIDGELRAVTFPTCWDEGLPATIASLWRTLLRVDNWHIEEGWRPEALTGNPFPSTWLLALLLLGQLPADGWAAPEKIDAWIRDHHPFWRGDKGACGVARFLLGLA